MILITGGAYQGKYEFARSELGISDGWIDGGHCRYGEIFSCKGINHFHELIRRCMAEGRSLDSLPHVLMKRNPGICIITDELGCGIVPVDKADRKFRETHGRICTVLAAEAAAVYRVICGIGVKIKDD